jgi:hypothetical protein
MVFPSPDSYRDSACRRSAHNCISGLPCWRRKCGERTLAERLSGLPPVLVVRHRPQLIWKRQGQDSSGNPARPISRNSCACNIAHFEGLVDLGKPFGPNGGMAAAALIALDQMV